MASGLNTRFREQYKKGGVLSCSDAGRFTRAQNKLKERRISRADEFGKQRNLEEFSNVIVQNTVTEDNQRKLKLQKWKEEKERKRLLEKKLEKPIFKVSAVSHKLGSPFLADVSNSYRSTNNKKGRNISCVSVNNKDSIAPKNFKFKAPTIRPLVMQPKENRIKPVISNVKVTTKTNKVEQPAISRRVTRSQTKCDQAKKFVTTRARGRENKLITASQTKSSSLVTIVEDELKGNSRTLETTDVQNMGSSIAQNNIPSGTDANMEAAEIFIASSAVRNDTSLGTESHPAINCKSSEVQGVTMPTEVAGVENCIPSNDRDVELSSTPKQCEDDTQFAITYSPYVTLERGSSRRKSARKSFGARMEVNSPTYISTGEEERKKHGIFYFRSVLKSETERLESLCDKWDDIRKSSDLPEDALGMISSAIGKTRLLLSQKFRYFGVLINKCENGPACGEQPITCNDLDGYWDFAYLEVEKIDLTFNKLEKLKSDNWNEEVIPLNKSSRLNPVTKKGKKVQKPAVSSLRALIAAARKKQKSETITSIESSDAAIHTPQAIRTPSVRRTPSSVRHSRQSLLHQAVMGQRHQIRGVSRESSPILMKVSHMVKMCINSTPPNSTSQVSDIFNTSEVPSEYKTPVTSNVPGRSILKTSVRDEMSEDISVNSQQTDANTKENEPKSNPTRKSLRKVRFEGAGNESPKIVQPMTPFVSRRRSRRLSDRLSLLGKSHIESPTPLPSTDEDLISFDTPQPEPQRVTRRSARLSLRLL